MRLMDRIVSATLLAVLGCGGCGHHHHEEVYAEPVPVGYVYEPGYYDRGYYRDNDWYWRGRDGHLYRERGDEHERRVREFDARREGRGEHPDQGERERH